MKRAVICLSLLWDSGERPGVRIFRKPYWKHKARITFTIRKFTATRIPELQG